MGCNKLLLDWQGSSLLNHVLKAWRESRVSVVVAVVRREDEAAQTLCRECGVEMICPDAATADMKESIQHGLRFLESRAQPLDHERWLLAPADLPGLSSALIDTVIVASEQREDIVLPRFEERNGHPVSFPWSMHRDVFQLAADEGINRLVRRGPTHPIEMPFEDHLEDVDTPADYHRMHAAPPRRSQQ